jgi:hypothetical protein
LNDGEDQDEGESMRGLRRVALRTLLTLGLAVSTLGGVVIATEAPAAAAFADCGTQRLCAWEHSNGGGARYEWGGSWHDTCWNVIPSQNDKISSVYNRLPVDITFYRDSGCGEQPGGSQFTVDSGETASQGSPPFVWYLNDTISSIYFH